MRVVVVPLSLAGLVGACGLQATGVVDATADAGPAVSAQAAEAGAPEAGPTIDAGTPKPSPVLACTTYTTCPGEGGDCCYTPATGSSCKKSCASPEQPLCQLSKDGCGEGWSCKEMTNPPASNVGTCVRYN